MTMPLVVLTLLVLLTHASCLQVDIVTERDSCANNSQTLCTTLSQCLSSLSSCITENATLIFQPGIHSTTGHSGLIAVEGIDNLHLLGQNSTIDCRTRVGFKFLHVDGLQISGLHLKNCGGTFTKVDVMKILPSQDYQAFTGTKVAVLIANSYDVDIKHLNIYNSSGYGLFAVNLLGHSNIYKSTIRHSNYASIGRYQHDYLMCKNNENLGCSGGNIVLAYERCSLCTGIHKLDISNVVIEYGANLQAWDVYLNHEAAGGMTVALSQSHSYAVDIVIKDSVISSNTGKYAGNAAVLLYSTISNITFTNTSFLRGNSEVNYYADISNSGGMYSAWVQYNEDRSLYRNLTINNCTFGNNSGGAIYIDTTNDDEVQVEVTSIIYINNSDIFSNRGHHSIVRLIAISTGESSVPTNQLLITLNSTRIYGNSPSIPGVTSISAVFCTSMHGLRLANLIVADNSLRGMEFHRTREISFSGTNYITGNTAENGGGLKICQSFFFVTSTSYLYIINNQAAVYGGGMYIFDDDNSNTCFFLVKNTSKSHAHNIIVRNNRANVSGNALFGGNVELCQLDGVFISNGYNAFNELFDIIFNRSLTEVTSNVRQLCLCRANRPDCSIKSESISIFPGQTFSVSAVAVGQLDGTIVDTAVSHILKNSNSSSMSLLAAQQDTQELLTVCTQLNYTLSSSEDIVTYIGVQTNYDKTRRPNSVLLTLEVRTASCPLGFSLDRKQMVCGCNNFLKEFGAECFIDQVGTILSLFPVWIGIRAEDNLLLAHNNCPFHHCKAEAVNITLNETDLQCQLGHAGVLCGGCGENLSAVFGSLSCTQCSNSHLSLLLAFAAAGILLVAVMIYGDLTLSHGTFNGLVFYANIVRVHHTLLFPPDHVNIITVFIAWINLDLGIKTCFFKGMDAYARTWLQYIFPGYVWILVVLIIFTGYYSKYAAKIFGSNAVQVLATLLLLSYTKIQRVILETLSSTFVSHENGSISVWLVDGNVEFMRGRHILLSTMSIVALLVFILPFTLILLCEYPLQAKFGTFMLRHKLTPFIDVYQGPYKIRFRWWSGAMLLVRTALLIIFGMNTLGDPRLNLILIVSTCTIMLSILWNVGTIYKERYINIIESFYLVNLGLLASWTLYYYSNYRSTKFLLYQNVVSYTCVSAGFIVFIAIVGGQIYLKVKRKIMKSRMP